MKPWIPKPAFAVGMVMTMAARVLAVEFHVSPAGSDASPGTRARPFLTLEAARDAVRKSGAGQGATVWLHAGRHFRSATFALDQRDSGTPDQPVVFRALPGAEVILDGGHILSSLACVPVRDPVVLERLLLEKMDLPGECFLDRDTGRFYLVPFEKMGLLPCDYRQGTRPDVKVRE
ncbi:MAG: hypothetical protein FJ387_28565 [Verrucomicrobia bacterium]|nr:hypothetical protein [Verrucomicrobiota bacterium]